MRTLKALALVVVSGCALLVTGGCGRSGGKGATIDASPGDVSAPDTFTSGSGGASVASGGVSGTGGANAQGGGDAPVGSGGIAAAGAVGISTGGNGAGGIGAGGAAGTATGGNGSGGIGSRDAAAVASGGGGSTSTVGTGGSAMDGSGGGGGGSGGKDASPVSTGGISMTGGTAVGRGGNIGSGGSSASSCPQKAPVNGAVCNQVAQCYYEDCATSGRTVAGCLGTSWQVTTGACSTFTCRAEGLQVTCPQGQICLATHGKAPVCVSQTCGTGPVTTECVPGSDPGTSGFCYTNGSTAEGITMFCCHAGGTSC
jgi:hypothetical protein